MAYKSTHRPIVAVSEAGGEYVAPELVQAPQEERGVVPFAKGVMKTMVQGKENIFAATAIESLKYTQTPYSEKKSFLRKVAEDVSALGASIPLALSHPLKTLKETVSTEETPIGGATVESIKQIVDKQYYEEHPALAVFNTGSWIATVASFGLSKALSSAMNTGLRTGLQSAGLSAAEHAVVAKAFTSKPMISALKGTAKKAVDTGETAIVREIVTNHLVKSGLGEAVASKVASGVERGLGGKLSRSEILKPLSMAANPLATGAKMAKKALDPIKRAVFGEQANTAVGRIYGMDVVKKDPSGFLSLERWAGQQAEERGLKNTIVNREKVMNEWSSTVGEWPLLSPEERVAYHKRYVAATAPAQRASELAGRNLVPVKFLSPTSVKAIKENIFLVDKEMEASKVIDELLQDHRDLRLHEQTLREVIARDPSRKALADAIDSLGRRHGLSNASSPELQAAIREVESHGYGLADAPKGKRVSYADSQAPVGAQAEKAAALEPKPELPPDRLAEMTSDAAQENLKAEIELRIEKYRKKAGLMAEREGAGVVHRNVYDAAGNFEFQAKDFKLVRAKANMARQARALKKYAHRLLYEFDPEFRELVDRHDAMLEHQLSTIPTAEAAEELLATLDEEINKIKEDIKGYEESPFSDLQPGEIESLVGIEKKAAGEAGKAEKVIGDAIPGADDLVGKKTRLSKLIERFGLSPEGSHESSIEFLFQDEFTQALVKDLSEKHGDIVYLDGRAVPLENLYEFVLKRRDKVLAARKSGLSKLFPGISQSLLDFSVDDFKNLGMGEKLARDVVNTAKKSLTNLPWQRTGLAGGITNFLRAKVPFNAYESYLKGIYHTRFNLNPLYGFQAVVETMTNVAFMLKDPKSVIRGSTFGHLIDKRFGERLRKVPYLKDLVLPEVTYDEIKIVQDEVLAPLGSNFIDAASNPEFTQLTTETAEAAVTSLASKAKAEKKIASSNVLHKFMGWHMTGSAVAMDRAIAMKFGFSLKDALAYDVSPSGAKTYKNPSVAHAIKEATEGVFAYKPGFLTSPLARTLNVVWFPFRFQAKTVQATARWVGSLSPLSRMTVMSSLNHFADWAASDEGVAWRKKNSDAWYATLNYIYAYESSGVAVESALKGKLFGGNTGRIGGMPFGFLVDIMRDLGFYPTDPDEVNPVTGKKFTRRVPKDLASLQTAVVVTEDLLLNTLPSMPFYTLTAGNAPSLRTWAKDVFEKGTATVVKQATEGTSKGAAKEFGKGFMQINPEETRFGR